MEIKIKMTPYARPVGPVSPLCRGRGRAQGALFFPWAQRKGPTAGSVRFSRSRLSGMCRAVQQQQSLEGLMIVTLLSSLVLWLWPSYDRGS